MNQTGVRSTGSHPAARTSRGADIAPYSSGAAGRAAVREGLLELDGDAVVETAEGQGAEREGDEGRAEPGDAVDEARRRPRPERIAHRGERRRHGIPVAHELDDRVVPREEAPVPEHGRHEEPRQEQGADE